MGTNESAGSSARLRRGARRAVSASDVTPQSRHDLAVICARDEELVGEITAQLIEAYGIAQADAVALLAPIAAHTGELVDVLGGAWGFDDQAIGDAVRAGHDLIGRRTSSLSPRA